MKRFVTSLTGLILLVLLATAVQGVTIETVPVGNLGNNADYTGYGAVHYAYNIGKYEVTAGQYCEFLNAVAATDSYGLYNSNMVNHPEGCQITQNGVSGNFTYDFSGRPSGTSADWENRPVNYVNWGDAARFANWLHNGQPTGAQDDNTTEDGVYDLSATQSYYGPNGQTPAYGSDTWDMLNNALLTISRKSNWKWAIPSEDEWYKAAYHKNDGDTGNYFKYPTSSDSTPSNKVVDPDPGNNANYKTSSPMKYSIGSPYYRTEVGEFENSGSPYGTFDQGGNVFEWDEAIIRGSCRGIRGGSYSYHGQMYASYRYLYKDPASQIYSTGFRLVQVPEPGTITLLLCGLASLLYWRRLHIRCRDR